MDDSTSNSVSFPVNSQDKRPLPEIIADLYGFKLAFVDHTNGNRYYAVQDWINGVTQTAQARSYWGKLQIRLKKAGNELTARCVKLPYYASNDRVYHMDFATAEVLIAITRGMGRQTGIRDLILGESTRAAIISGYVYVLHFEPHSGEYKIGIAANLEQRMKIYRTENPPSMRLIADCAFHYTDCRAIEKELHTALKQYRIRGEWFALTHDQIPSIEHWLSVRSTSDLGA